MGQGDAVKQEVVEATAVVPVTLGVVGRAHRAAPDLQRRFDGPGGDPPDELGAGPRAGNGCRPSAGEAQKDRAIDRIGLCLGVVRAAQDRESAYGGGGNEAGD